MANGTTPKKRHDVDEVWGAIEDLRHDMSTVKTGMAGIIAKIDTLAESVRNINQDRKVPWGVIIGAIGVSVSLVTALGGAALAPLYMTDAYQANETRQNNELIAQLRKRELDDTYERGKSHEKFNTLEERINGAINNRKDIDEKHVAAQQKLGQRIDEVAHELDNGLGRRISEMVAPLTERIIALERKAYGDITDQRDFDRK